MVTLTQQRGSPIRPGGPWAEPGPPGGIPTQNPPRPMVPIPTPQQITALVDSQELYLEPLRSRMDKDWALATLEEFDAGPGYRSYTSNEPMVYFDKITVALASGKLQIRYPVSRSRRQKREKEAAAERFHIGILRLNDERLLRLGQPRLVESLAGFTCLRGWYCGRATLAKDLLTGETYPDITPWDPIQVSWGMGPKGLKWICHKSKKTYAEILEQYGIDVNPNSAGGSPDWAETYFSNQAKDNSLGVDVYDWLDEANSMVVINGEFAKPPTPHGAWGRVPAFFGAVGPLPLIQARSQSSQTNLVHQGESIFAANRRIYEKVNLVLSTMLQLVALSRDQAILLYSPDGSKTLKDNPSLEGSVVSLSTQDKLEIMPLIEMSRDTGAFLGLLSAEVQRGALPYSVYGQLAFQLSGYAVNLLKQATESPLLPRQHAVQNAIWQITDIIGGQFASRAFPNMRLQGYGQNRDFFDEEFGPEMLIGLPSAEVKLTPATVQDQLQNMQLAKLASEGPWPALPWRVIWDEILGMQDTDSIADAIKEQVSERLLPTATLMTLMQAAEKQGRPELAMLYYRELIMQGIMGGPNQAGGPSGKGAQNNGGGGGFSPEVLPQSAQGQAPPQPTPQAGSNMPPRSPRAPRGPRLAPPRQIPT